MQRAVGTVHEDFRGVWLTGPVPRAFPERNWSGSLKIAGPAGLVEDTLPARFLNTPLPSDPTAAINRQQFEALVTEYHRQRGW